MNVYGEGFDIQVLNDSDAKLQQLSGPAGSEAEVARAFVEFARILQPLRQDLRQVLLSERYSWQLRMDSGLVVQLGRDLAKDGVNDRLVRFVAYYPKTLGGLNRRHEYADLRYSNGIVLRVPGLQRAEEKSAKPKV